MNLKEIAYCRLACCVYSENKTCSGCQSGDYDNCKNEDEIFAMIRKYLM